MSDFFYYGNMRDPSGYLMPYAMQVGRFSITSPNNCSDEDLKIMLLVFLASDVAPKSELTVDSAALRVLTSLINEHPELLGGFGRAHVDIVWQENDSITPEEIEFLGKISDRIGSLHVCAGLPGAKVVTKEVVDVLRKALAAGPLLQVRIPLENCDNCETINNLFELLSSVNMYGGVILPRTGGVYYGLAPMDEKRLSSLGGVGNIEMSWNRH